jgi:putative zinc finger/helix-turn-helix YgiT family protein
MMKNEINCLSCGDPMVVSTEAHRYGDGLDVVLRDVEIRRCRSCGEEEVAISRIKDVHKTIAFSLAQKPTRLTPAEIRFLRTYLGYSSSDFASRLGVTRSTVSRWESGKRRTERGMEMVIRLMTLLGQKMKSYDLAAMGSKDADQERMFFAPTDTGWEPIAAVR